MASIGSLLSDLQFGSGIFSPITPFRNEKKLARALAPALVSAAGGVERANIDRAGALDRSRIARSGEIQRTGMEQTGALERVNTQQEGLSHRQKAAIAGDKIIAEMTAKNKIAVQEIASAGGVEEAKVRSRYAYDATVDPINSENDMILQLLQNRRNSPEYSYQPPNETAAPSKKKKKDEDEEDVISPYLDLSY